MIPTSSALWQNVSYPWLVTTLMNPIPPSPGKQLIQEDPEMVDETYEPETGLAEPEDEDGTETGQPGPDDEADEGHVEDVEPEDEG